MFDGFSNNLIRLSRRLALQAPAGKDALGQVWREASTLVNAPRVAPTPSATASGGRSTEIATFGANPGRLRMFLHVPPTPPLAGAPLVILLHGCGQHATQFGADSGWAAMADRLGFPVVLPEQVRGNNAGRCFNWFVPADTLRDQGEARSIREMVGTAVARFRSDERRVFVVGLSAGGAMAAALLAAYPDVFAAGAAVAGLPVGVATNVNSALSVMGGRHLHLTPDEWAAHARALAPAGYDGPWPRLQVWQGTADHTVASANAEALTTQWAALARIDPTPTRDVWVTPGLRHRRWEVGETAPLESWTVDAMSHGYPTLGGRDVCDRFVLRTPVDATEHIAAFLGLTAAG